MAKQEMKAFSDQDPREIALRVSLELERNPERTVASTVMSENWNPKGEYMMTTLVVFNIEETAAPSVY